MFKAEAAQKKLDRLEEQKFMRLRERRDRADKADMVQKLLKRVRTLEPAQRCAVSVWFSGRASVCTALRRRICPSRGARGHRAARMAA